MTKETKGDVRVYTGVNTVPKVQITGWYHARECPRVMNVMYMNELLEWYTPRLSSRCCARAGGLNESGIIVRKVGPYPAEKWLNEEARMI